MRPRSILLALACALAGACAGASAGEPALERFERERPAMGTTFRIVLYAPDAALADAAADAAFDRIDALEDVFSDYDAASEARRLAARAPVDAPASPELCAVTRLALEVGERTGGAFDVTVGPLTALWRRALRQGTAPEPAALAAARAAVGAHLVAVGDERVALHAAGMRLDYGGIAKGYALDQALAALRARGVERALVDGGGDVACGAPPPGRAGWVVALEGGEALLVRDAALATSGDLARGGLVDGRAVSHLIDPRTGAPAPAEPGSASVLARDAALADALASALLLLGPERGIAAVETFPGVEARIVRPEGTAATRGFPALVSSDGRLAPPEVPPQEPER